MGYYTRVLSKDEEFPPFDELAQFVRAEHPDFKLTLEEGTKKSGKLFSSPAMTKLRLR